MLFQEGYINYKKHNINKYKKIKGYICNSDPYGKNVTYIRNIYITDNIIIDKIETPKGIDEEISMKDRMYFIEQIPMGFMEEMKKVIDEMTIRPVDKELILDNFKYCLPSSQVRQKKNIIFFYNVRYLDNLFFI